MDREPYHAELWAERECLPWAREQLGSHREALIGGELIVGERGFDGWSLTIFAGDDCERLGTFATFKAGLSYAIDWVMATEYRPDQHGNN